MKTPGWMLGTFVLAAATSAAGADRTSALLDAVRGGDSISVRALLLDKSVDVNARTVDGTTALHLAVERDDAKMAEGLVRAGADVHAANRYGIRPLAIAAVNGNAAIVGLLLDAGADPNAGLSSGETSVMTAARAGKVEALKLLLSRGGDANFRDPRGQTALMWAAARNNADAVRALIAARADIAVRTNNPAKGRAAEMSVFSSPASTGFTALLFAVRAGAIDATKALLDAGAPVNDALSDGESAIVVAAANAHWELVDVLLDRGADPNAAGAGWNALHQIVHSRRPNLGYTPSTH